MRAKRLCIALGKEGGGVLLGAIRAAFEIGSFCMFHAVTEITLPAQLLWVKLTTRNIYDIYSKTFVYSQCAVVRARGICRYYMHARGARSVEYI